MESSGAAGYVNISCETYDRVKDVFVCEHRGKVTAKNLGEIDMFFVRGPREGFTSANGTLQEHLFGAG